MTLLQVKNRKQHWYGESIGILVLDANYPCIPGNVANASTFPFPVRYKVVREASIERLLKKRDRTLLDKFVEAAIELQEEGVKAVTGACGFMALYQREVSAALRIPVFLTSLLQIPFIHSMLNPKRKIGVVTADSESLGPEFLISAGVDERIPLVIKGMEKQKEFREAILEERGSLNSAEIEKELLWVTRSMIDENRDIGAILLECSDLPPYGESIQREFGLPVFDYVTMIDYVHSSVVRKGFTGFM